MIKRCAGARQTIDGRLGLRRAARARVHSRSISWTDAGQWRQAAINSTRCLIGCSAGDFGMMFALSTFAPTLSTAVTVPTAMAAGIATSIAFETWALTQFNGMSRHAAFATARGMSLISMLTMEAVENAIALGLGGGTWNGTSLSILSVSMLGGWLAPLPFNYFRLVKHGKACH